MIALEALGNVVEGGIALEREFVCCWPRCFALPCVLLCCAVVRGLVGNRASAHFCVELFID